ncbi:MAG: ImmA/IrrE family metallo-endopeptidase [Bacilli bacterium]|nr:ImmA/IrrE family metallo-endopeptidase [Bacilli bacterium]
MGLKVIFSSKLADKLKRIEREASSLPPGITIYDEKEQRFIVMIDDEGTFLARQRFSLAHEIGHIRLGHDEQNPINETEAEIFAHQLLVPTALAIKIPDHLANLEFLEKTFGIAKSTARISLRYRQDRLTKCNRKQRDYEKIIVHHLGASLASHIERYERELKHGIS